MITVGFNGVSGLIDAKVTVVFFEKSKGHWIFESLLLLVTVKMKQSKAN